MEPVIGYPLSVNRYPAVTGRAKPLVCVSFEKLCVSFVPSAQWILKVFFILPKV